MLIHTCLGHTHPHLSTLICTGRLAGLEVIRIIREPIAAALAYGLDLKQDRTVGVNKVWKCHSDPKDWGALHVCHTSAIMLTFVLPCQNNLTSPHLDPKTRNPEAHT